MRPKVRVNFKDIINVRFFCFYFWILLNLSQILYAGLRELFFSNTKRLDSVHPFMRINDIKYSFGKIVVKIMNNQIKYNHC